MKYVQLIGLIACGMCIGSCQSTNTAGGLNGSGNQEAKRRAALAQQQQEQAQQDEAQQNLWSAQQDNMNRVSTTTRHY